MDSQTTSKIKFLDAENSNIRFIKETKALLKSSRWRLQSSKIAMYILDYLEEKNISKKVLAARLRISEQAVGKMLKGQQNFTIDTINKLEEATGLDLFGLLQRNKSVCLDFTQVLFKTFPIHIALLDYPHQSKLNYNFNSGVGRSVTSTCATNRNRFVEMSHIVNLEALNNQPILGS